MRTRYPDKLIRAHRFFLEGRVAAAVEAYAELLAERPADPQVRTALGLILAQLEETEALDPQFAAARSGLKRRMQLLLSWIP